MMRWEWEGGAVASSAHRDADGQAEDERLVTQEARAPAPEADTEARVPGSPGRKRS